MAKRPAPKSKIDVCPPYELQAVILSRFDTLQYPNTVVGAERRLGLDSLITPAGKSDETDGNGSSVYYGSVCFQCTREGDNDLTSVHMAAMFSFAFSCESDVQEHIDAVAKSVASTSVWSQFMNLFGLANTQMRSRLPLLPSKPGPMQQQPLEKLVEVFADFGAGDDPGNAPS